MDHDAIVDQICDQADDFLGGVTKRDQAKAGIAEWLAIHHPEVALPDRQLIGQAAMVILEAEEFFTADAGGEE